MATAQAVEHYASMAAEAALLPKRRHGDAKSVGSHTPGPWFVELHTADGAGYRNHSGLPLPEGVRISVRAGYINDRERPGVAMHVTREVDARLIAAAPDLLEAGTNAAGALQGAADALRMSGHPRTADKLLEMTLPLLRALKKATVPA